MSIKPSEVAASLRRLADLIEFNDDFGQAAEDAYLFRGDVLMSVNHVDHPRQLMEDVAHAAASRRIEVRNSDDGKWTGIRLLLGSFEVFVYCDPDKFRADMVHEVVAADVAKRIDAEEGQP